VGRVPVVVALLDKKKEEIPEREERNEPREENLAGPLPRRVSRGQFGHGGDAVEKVLC
jgi:hypothetical protein